jgi:hypothetical protein
MAEDIIYSVPIQCGEKDCPVQWHRHDYWIYTTGKRATFSCYDGSDHEDVRKSDLHSFAEQDQLWREYAQHVAATGEDPIGEYMVKREITRRERWTFQFSNSICGMLLVKASRNGIVFAPKDLPKHVREYAAVTRVIGRGPAAGCAHVSWQKGDVKLTRNGRITETLDHRIPRKAADIRRELQARARKHLASTEKRTG